MKMTFASFIVLVLSLPVLDAQAADQFDLWLDAFTIPGFSVTSVREEKRTGEMGQNILQFVEGNIDGKPVRIITEMNAQYGGFSKPSFDPITRNLAGLSRYFGIEDARNYKRVKGPGLLGGQIDFRSGQCRAIIVGAGRKSDAYTMSVSIFSCEANAAISEYASRIKPSNRDKNAAGFAAFGGDSGQDQTANKKSVLYRKCEEAKEDSGQMAAFMQELPSGQLARFLDSDQSCALFDN